MENAASMQGGTPRIVILSVILIALCAPHAAEDFQFGAFARLGVTPALPAVALGVMFAAQVAGAYLVGCRSRVGFALLIAVGAIWSVGAAIVHGPEIVASGDYRNGVISKALEVGIMLVGAAMVVVGSIEWRQHRP
jgi:hypothetical protein